MGQGTVGGGLVFSLGLSEGMSDTFDSSTSEICYGPVRLQPIMYQDDFAKCSNNIRSAQDGCYKIEIATGQKQLNMNVDKSLLLGNKSRVTKIR